jgi:hypothetical protein
MERPKKTEFPMFLNYLFVKVDAPNKGYVFQVKEIVSLYRLRKSILTSEKVKFSKSKRP